MRVAENAGLTVRKFVSGFTTAHYAWGKQRDIGWDNVEARAHLVQAMLEDVQLQLTSVIVDAVAAKTGHELMLRH
eukprot:1217569-Amphidinium_carterae.2